jgi:hypothetical protein
MPQIVSIFQVAARSNLARSNLTASVRFFFANVFRNLNILM